MFKVTHIKDESKGINYLELSNLKANAYAKIDLILGGSLQELTLNTKSIIKNLYPFEYEESYASAILFPFVNRIENGSYSFNKKKYQLPINDIEDNNALHGLVYNKTFEFIGKQISNDFASVTINYKETKKNSGFPFNYEMSLNYMLSVTSFTLNITVKNIDSDTFPFNLGWHPYFYTNDLYNSYLRFKANEKIMVNQYKIPLKKEQVGVPDSLQIKDFFFDDCYILNDNLIEFLTPEYIIDFSFLSKETYLQLYTPKTRNAIAIELQTSAPNSFNNNMGLQILHSQECYNASWKIDLKITN